MGKFSSTSRTINARTCSDGFRIAHTMGPFSADIPSNCPTKSDVPPSISKYLKFLKKAASLITQFLPENLGEQYTICCLVSLNMCDTLHICVSKVFVATKLFPRAVIPSLV